jgi:deazaflavin-dependent oxidoreductase (nitroreductase family)
MMMTFVDQARTGLGQAVRTFNKHLLNPVMLGLAGRPYWYAARLEHVGRRSGRSYATPVVATAVPGGFVVPLPYGTEVDWLRNLRASGKAAIVVHGERYVLNDPEVMTTAEISPDLPRREQYRAWIWRIGHWLRVSARPQQQA